MLRRDFIISSSLTFGGLLFAGRLLFADSSGNRRKTLIRIKQSSRVLRGHPRSGCASPPELAPMLEHGITEFPLL